MSRVGKFLEIESRRVLSGAEGRGEWGVMTYESEFSFWVGGNILKLVVIVAQL